MPGRRGSDAWISIELFPRAGPPKPTLFCDCPVGGGKDLPLDALVAETLESVLPQLVRLRILTADSITIKTLETRIRDDVLEARNQIVGPAQFCAWTRV